MTQMKKITQQQAADENNEQYEIEEHIFEYEDPNYYDESIKDGTLKESVNNFVFINANERMTIGDANNLSEDIFYKLIGEKEIKEPTK